MNLAAAAQLPHPPCLLTRNTHLNIIFAQIFVQINYHFVVPDVLNHLELPRVFAFTEMPSKKKSLAQNEDLSR